MQVDIFKKRYDCFLIWPHGMPYLMDILKLLEEDHRVTIKIIKINKVSSIKGIVKKIYSFDYAPWMHLKNKTKYLMKLEGREIAYIFVENRQPNIDFFDFDRFRHDESLTIKEIKNKIREIYNPKNKERVMSHNHVIHATDNEKQTIQMLELAKLPIECLYGDRGLFDSPWFIDTKKGFEIKHVNINSLKAGQIDDNGKVIKVNLNETKQYRALIGKEEEYSEYLKKNIGRSLLPYYSVSKFLHLKENFKYLEGLSNSSYIIVTYDDDNDCYILDGLHRASLCLYQKHDKILVCVKK